MAAAAVASGASSLVVVAYHADGGLRGGFSVEQNTIYGPAHVVLAVALTAAGVLLAFSRRSGQIAALLGVIGLLAAQLAGVGLVGYRRWPLYWGASATGLVTHQDLLRRSALVMATVCAVTALASLVVLVAQGMVRWQGWATATAVPVAVAVLFGIPPLIADDGFGTHNTIAAVLTYSVPFAVALAVSAMVDRPASICIASAVAVSAIIAVVGNSMLDLILPFHDARWWVVGAAVVVGLGSLLPRSGPMAERQA